MQTNAPPKSLTDVIWEEVQQQAVDMGQKALDLASTGVLYVAKEIVFALSGDATATDRDHDSMRNDLEDGEVAVEFDLEDLEDGDEDSLLKSLRKELARENSKSKSNKSKNKKPKKDKDKHKDKNKSKDMIKDKSGKGSPRSTNIDKRDEESERSQKVGDLIKIFDNSTGAPVKPKWRSITVDRNAGRTPAVQKPTYDILVARSSRSMAPPSQAKQNSIVTTKSPQKFDTLVVQTLTKSRETQLKETQPKETQPTGKSQDIFRPRSANKIALDESERFAYLGNDRTTGHPKPEDTFSPFAPFKEIHQATKALIDDTTFDTRSDHESTHPNSHEANPASTCAMPENTDPIPEIVDIRAEIEDIQRIIGKLEEERAQQRLQEETMASSGTKSTGYDKDPMKAEEIRMLIRRLARLSQRHRELKSKNASSAKPDLAVNVSSVNQVIDLSRLADTETRVPPAM